jgi:hypothetical protein
LDVRNFLSKFINLKVISVSGSSNLDASKSFSLIGYGPLRKSSQLAIETNFGTFSMISSRYPHYANWVHALDELLVEDPEYISISKIQRGIRRFVRAISIGASRGSHFAGICNGFMWTASIPSESTFIKLVSPKDTTIHISRRASRTGLIVTDYSQEMERVFRRSLDRDNFYITSHRAMNRDQDCMYPSSSFPNLVLGIRSLSLDTVSDSLLLQPSETSSAVNSYIRLFQTSITPQGIAFQLDMNGSVNLITHATTHYWPSSLWNNRDEKIYVSPTIVGEVEVAEPAAFFYWSNNWAHFIEDNLPSVLGLIHKDPLRKIFTIGNLSPVQMETLQILFPESTFEPMLEGYLYRFNDVLLNIHNDSRNLHIMGSDSDIDMIDEIRLREIRKQVLSSVKSQPESDLRLLISRRTGFRQLVNRNTVQEIFQEFGFTIVHAEDLGFAERLKLFQNARIVAGETGAGMVNLYFCKDHTKVIELRHPSVAQSLEHRSLVAVTSHDYHMILGKEIGFYEKLRYGSDAYSADESEIRNVLQNLYQ